MPNLLIKNVPQGVIDLFDRVKKETDKTALPAFELLLRLYSEKPIPADPGNSDEVNQLREELGLLQQSFESANDQITSLQDQLQQASSRVPELGLTGNQFVYEPAPDLYKKMTRVISYLIRKGRFSKSDKDLAQQLVTKSLNYTINNEYADILK